MADIILKNANGTPQAYNGVTKIKVPTADGGTATFSEGSGGGGIEEVTELPVASAENVGKIYRYEGQLYECKEVMGFACDCADLETMFQGNGLPVNFKYNLVDSEPNVEDMEISIYDEENLNVMMVWYVLKDGTNAWATTDGIEKTTIGDFYDPISCVVEKLNASYGKMCFWHTYKNVLVNNNIIDGFACVGKDTKVKKFVVSEEILYFSTCFANDGFLEEIIFEGTPRIIVEGAFNICLKLKTIDLSNCVYVPELINNKTILECPMLQEIRVPSALLEEFKTATNWSEYADYMVGV